MSLLHNFILIISIRLVKHVIYFTVIFDRYICFVTWAIRKVTFVSDAPWLRGALVPLPAATGRCRSRTPQSGL